MLLGMIALWWEANRYEDAYERLAPNTTKAVVLKQFGKPNEIRKCRASKPVWDAEPLQMEGTRCVEEFWYFSRITPEQWVIGFDKDARAITKYHFVSP